MLLAEGQTAAEVIHLPCPLCPKAFRRWGRQDLSRLDVEADLGGHNTWVLGGWKPTHQEKRHSVNGAAGWRCSIWALTRCSETPAATRMWKGDGGGGRRSVCEQVDSFGHEAGRIARWSETRRE